MTPEDIAYANFHQERFDYLLDLAQSLVPADAAILQVGVGPLSLFLHPHFNDLTSFGIPVGQDEVTGLPHIGYDLLTAPDTPIPTERRFDLIIYAEVIEHLYQAPEISIQALSTLLKPDARMIIQTPNAAALVKRLALLAGRNPYDKLHTDPSNPGHVREYTRAELIEATEQAGLQVESHAFASYFSQAPLSGLALRRRGLRGLQRGVPAFRDGQILVARQK